MSTIMPQPGNEPKKTTVATPFVRQVCTDLLSPFLLTPNRKIVVLGIDGPTAAGKTIFADALADEIGTAYQRKTWVYRLDWTLESREKRVRDLKHLHERNDLLYHEAELHMRLDGFRRFLETIRAYNEHVHETGQSASHPVTLENLYSREHNGTVTGTRECVLESGLIILAEGHYTLRTEFANLIDQSILLLGDTGELLRRKTARVGDYRQASDAEDYFRRVDLPSFDNHLSRFGCNADLVVDNTDYINPRIQRMEFIADWLAQRDTPRDHAAPASGPLNVSIMTDRVLSRSLLVDEQLRSALGAVLQLIIDWDGQVARYLRINIDALPGDLTSLGDQLLSMLNERFAGTSLRFAIKHTNALYNVYSRTLPISLGIEIEGDHVVRVLADVYHEKLRLQICWGGGYYRYDAERRLGDVSNNVRYDFHESPRETAAPRDAHSPVRVITPTRFTIPGFLNDFRISEVFSGREEENISASQALIELADSGGVWIHRFATFAELHFFLGCVMHCGGNAIKVGNYLIAVQAQQEALRTAFKLFREEWIPRVSDRETTAQDERQLDAIIDDERQELHRFVRKHCPDFTVWDGFLHSSLIAADSGAWKPVIDQVGLLLNADSRLIRKKAIQFIQQRFPDLSLDVSGLWEDVPAGAKTHISLDALTTISPTILAELYLWLALRDDRSAVLGVNIYDIRERSADCRSYLKAAAIRQTAIVFQGSLNSLGQAEHDDGRQVHGYLRPKQGVHDLIVAVSNAARDLVLTAGGVPPLFGIGLDHVDVAGDRPVGRAARFLHDALATEWVTHCVLDGTSPQPGCRHCQDERTPSFAAIARFCVALLGGARRSYIYDKEVCSGELNYAAGTVDAFIPTPRDVELFVQIYQQQLREAGLGAFNTRPALLVGNLGTTHHDRDRDSVEVERSRSWRDRVKRRNFVSAVLHGTTKTHPHVLAQATTGCHKINIAGDSLHTFVRALPQPLQRTIAAGDREPKRMMAEIRESLNGMSSAEMKNLEDSLHAYCRALLDTINAPRLTPPDVEYFRYRNYKFTRMQSRAICEALTRQIESNLMVKADTPADRTSGRTFFASLVEVPFDDEYKRLTHVLWEEGVRNFHVDAGDGKFIPRVISGLEKAEYLRTNFPEAVIHGHLMVENPGSGAVQKSSAIERYIAAGCNSIAVHRRAFPEERYFLSALELIRNHGARPGIIIETSEVLDSDLENLIRRTGLDWIVVMGVPVGYGGQIFDMSALKRIAWLHQFSVSVKLPLLIEVDGGLTLDNLSLCRRSGAQAFSGYSLINDATEAGVRKKIRTVFEILS